MIELTLPIFIVMKIPNKRELQQIVHNHSSDIDFKGFMNRYKKCAAKPSSFLRIHWRLSTILKTGSKIAWSIVFSYVKVCVFWKCISDTIHWKKNINLKKNPFNKINDTKKALFFLSLAPTHHSFTSNFRFFYDLKHKVCLSKTVCGIFHFWFRYIFN